MARKCQFSITNIYLPPHHSYYSSNHQNEESWLDHLPKVPGLVCGTSLLITIPGMIMSVQTLGTRHFTTRWMSTPRLCLVMVLKCETWGVARVLESVQRLYRWSIRLWLIASHGKPFKCLARTTSHCIKEECDHTRRAPNTPMWIGLSSSIALVTVSMRCHQLGPCPNVWRPSVTS